MLHELHIRNFAIIDEVAVEFDKGLNVLTGETGAGKSVIIDALCLALGERASIEHIRSGEKEALIEAFFDIPHELLNSNSTFSDLGINIDDGIILKRIISAQGKSRAYINDSMVNIQTLSQISRGIIDVHGQYEHQSLLFPSQQIELIDAAAGLISERQEVTALYEAQIKLKQKISGLLEKERERAQRIDILMFQINEIESAGLKIGEDEELSGEIKILSNASRLAELANHAYDFLYSSENACITNLSKTLNLLKEISLIDAKAEEALKSSEESLSMLQDVAYFLRDYKEGIDFNPERLERAQERLELIKGLKRKYGNNIQEILAYKGRAFRELDELQHAEERLETLRAELENIKIELGEKAHALSRKRKNAAKNIEQQVVKELSALSMPNTRFSIHITNENGEDTIDGLKANPHGIDKVEFLLSPNVGEELRPLSKIASGGELSRIMLALKSILSEGDRIPVIIFDEIDAGIGGAAAETVGRKLKALSARHQVICITHLPQIASYADTHLRIEKKVLGQRTKVEIRKIEGDERTKEIARMLSGDSSDVSIKHAKEMLRKTVRRDA